MKTFKLVKTTDPRRIEFYNKAFPNSSNNEREELRQNWITKNIKHE